MKSEFTRINLLPNYVFAEINQLKAKLRKKGNDIIDFGMGNPDMPTPKHIRDKLKEVVSHERMREEITKMMKHDTIKSLELLSKIPGLMEIVFSNGMWLMPTTKK